MAQPGAVSRTDSQGVTPLFYLEVLQQIVIRLDSQFFGVTQLDLQFTKSGEVHAGDSGVADGSLRDAA